MSRRIEPRPYRIGTPESTEPEVIEELQNRAEKHERITRGKPVKTFKDVLKKKMRGEDEEEEKDEQDEPEENKKGAKDPLLGLDPNQSSAIANKRAKVIVKG